MSNKSPIQKGAFYILVTLVFLPFVGWLSITLVGAVEDIATFKGKDETYKVLIKSVDNKVDSNGASIRRVEKKLDKIIFLLK